MDTATTPDVATSQAHLFVDRSDPDERETLVRSLPVLMALYFNPWLLFIEGVNAVSSRESSGSHGRPRRWSVHERQVV